MGIDAFVAFPTVGKVRPDMFHVIGLVEGAKMNLVSSWHKTTSDVKSRCISTAEIEIAYHSLISSCENMKPLIIPTNQLLEASPKRQWQAILTCMRDLRRRTSFCMRQVSLRDLEGKLYPRVQGWLDSWNFRFRNAFRERIEPALGLPLQRVLAPDSLVAVG